MENTHSEPGQPERFDIFISYRRGGGAAEARSIRAALQERGFRVFLDVDDLRSGHFDEALLKHIESAPNFLVILSPNSLDRCAEEGDWLRREISYAIKLEKNILPVLLPGFQFPKEIPAEIRDLPRHQSMDYSHIYFPAMIAKVSANLRLVAPVPAPADLVQKPVPSAAPLKYIGIAAAAALVLAGVWLVRSNRPPAAAVDEPARETVKNTVETREPANEPAKAAEETVRNTVETREPANEPAKAAEAAGKLSLEAALVYLGSDSNLHLVKDGTALTSKDNYALYMRPVQDCRVYIYQADSKGNVTRIFPNAQLETGDNFLRAGQEYWAPNSRDFYFLDENKGTETVYFIAAREKLPALETLVSGSQPEFQEKVKDLKLMGVAGKRSINVRRTRPIKGTAADLLTRHLDSSKDFYYKISFKHE